MEGINVNFIVFMFDMQNTVHAICLFEKSFINVSRL